MKKKRNIANAVVRKRINESIIGDPREIRDDLKKITSLEDLKASKYGKYIYGEPEDDSAWIVYNDEGYFWYVDDGEESFEDILDGLHDIDEIKNSDVYDNCIFIDDKFSIAVFDYEGDHYVWHSGRVYDDLHTALSDMDTSDIESHIEHKFEEEFWKHTPTLYHYTDSENVDSIIEDGIIAGNRTRGIGNRGISDAVFTLSNAEAMQNEMPPNSSVFSIDTLAMKSDGLMPEVSKEPDIVEYEARELLASMLSNATGKDIYWNGSIEPGMFHETVIVHRDIPPKYLKIEDF